MSIKAKVVERPCIWCHTTMETQRQDKRVCSTQCQNQMSYIRRRDWPWLTNEEFHKVIQNWMAEGSHPNPDHPLNVIDRAYADFYRAATNLINAGTEILKETKNA